MKESVMCLKKTTTTIQHWFSYFPIACLSTRIIW